MNLRLGKRLVKPQLCNRVHHAQGLILRSRQCLRPVCVTTRVVQNTVCEMSDRFCIHNHNNDAKISRTSEGSFRAGRNSFQTMFSAEIQRVCLPPTSIPNFQVTFTPASLSEICMTCFPKINVDKLLRFRRGAMLSTVCSHALDFTPSLSYRTSSASGR